MSDNLSELPVVSVEPTLLLLAQELQRSSHNVILAQVCDLTDAVMVEFLLVVLKSLHLILLLAMDLDVLLSDEFKELAHLILSWVVSLLVVPAARAILVVLFIVRAE